MRGEPTITVAGWEISVVSVTARASLVRIVAPDMAQYILSPETAEALATVITEQAAVARARRLSKEPTP